MKSLNENLNKVQQNQTEDQVVTNASTKAYEAAMCSLEEARAVKKRQAREIEERYKILKGGKYGEK